MCSHDKLTPPLYACTEGYHLTVLHFLPSLQRLYIARVRIGRCVTMTREVLDATCNTRILQSLQVVCHHRCCHLRLVAEGTGTDDDVVRIGVHVSHGSKVDVEVVFLQVGTDGVATFVGILWVARFTDRRH